MDRPHAELVMSMGFYDFDEPQLSSKTFHANKRKNSNPDLVEQLDVENKAELEYRILWIFR